MVIIDEIRRYTRHVLRFLDEGTAELVLKLNQHQMLGLRSVCSRLISLSKKFLLCCVRVFVINQIIELKEFEMWNHQMCLIFNYQTIGVVIFRRIFN